MLWKKAIEPAANAGENKMDIRSSDFKLQLKEGAVKDYEKVVLSSGLCELFMPMGFVSSEEGELAFYHCSGYTPLKECNITEAKEALEILEKTFILVSRAGEYLIAPSSIMLNLNTIFYNKDTKQVRIAYVPAEQESMTLQENMAGLISQVEYGIRGNQKVYLEKIKKQLEEKNYYIKDMIDLIGALKRKIGT